MVEKRRESKVGLRDITQVFHLGEQFGTGKQ